MIGEYKQTNQRSTVHPSDVSVSCSTPLTVIGTVPFAIAPASEIPQRGTFSRTSPQAC